MFSKKKVFEKKYIKFSFKFQPYIFFFFLAKEENRNKSRQKKERKNFVMTEEEIHHRVMELVPDTDIWPHVTFDKKKHLYIVFQRFGSDFSHEKQNICSFIDHQPRTQKRLVCGSCDDDPTLFYTAQQMDAPIDVISKPVINLDELALSIMTYPKEDIQDAFESMNDFHPLRSKWKAIQDLLQ